MRNNDWKVIADAIAYYPQHGYTYVETPWIVPINTLMITCPRMGNIYSVDVFDGLVGSAEQGFLDMQLAGQLETERRYVSAGPCFRDEDVDQLHQKHFFKVELFLHSVSQERASAAAKQMLTDAYGFMLLRSSTRPVIVDEGHGWDININGIEVGSYGYRYHEQIGFWAYGTGIAEPRFTQAQATE